MSPDKLAYMANQIGKFFAHQPHDRRSQSIADHLRKFWDPRMRGTILAHYDAVKGSLTRWSSKQLNNCAKLPGI